MSTTGWRNGSVTVLFNKGNGHSATPVWLYAGDLPDDVTAGDFNGDGNTGHCDCEFILLTGHHAVWQQRRELLRWLLGARRRLILRPA